MYIIPGPGKFDGTIHPVGEEKIIKVKNGNGEEIEKTIFEPYPNAVQISDEDYEALENCTKCWNHERTKLIPYIPSGAQSQLNLLVQEYQETSNKLAAAEQFLQENDYVGRKIAEALLMDDTQLLAELKVKYKDIIEESKEARAVVNPYRAKLIELQEKIRTLRLEVNQE